MKPNWIRLAENYPELEMSRINIDKNQRAASQAEIESIPQAVVIYKGREIGRVIGLLDYNAVVHRLARMKAANP
jgi:thioredoxin-like negative regulator of GroEL